MLNEVLVWLSVLPIRVCCLFASEITSEIYVVVILVIKVIGIGQSWQKVSAILVSWMELYS